jgi:hypothetical protein
MLREYNKIFSQEDSNKKGKYLSLTGIIIAVIITFLVLFKPPMPGVADQGDFQRVMTAVGLVEIAEDNYEEPHWFKYVSTKYNMFPLSISRLTGLYPTTSMIYPISLARLGCRLMRMQYFSTKVLAFVYASIYIFSLYLCFHYIGIKKSVNKIFFILLGVFILMDGNYLIWFNSLYGEAMMIVGFLLLIGTVLYSVHQLERGRSMGVVPVFIAAFLFLGAKMQCFSALPIIIFLIVRINLYVKSCLTTMKRIEIKKRRMRLGIPLLLLLFYVSGIYIQVNALCGIDTEYNSVFYGILKSSQNPEKDLMVLGLSPEMAVEAGKHAYLPKDQYVKYQPWSEITKNEFNKKISNFRILKFYLLHPRRLISGMEYTASKAYDTRTSLGKYERDAVKEYTHRIHRFTLWSDFRSAMLPRTLFFLIPFYCAIVVISVYEYTRNSSKTHRLRIELLWSIIIIGIIQFPMPYIGNGEADTAKQLFLFNYSFDIVFLIAATWIFSKLCKMRKIFI